MRISAWWVYAIHRITRLPTPAFDCKINKRSKTLIGSRSADGEREEGKGCRWGWWIDISACNKMLSRAYELKQYPSHQEQILYICLLCTLGWTQNINIMYKQLRNNFGSYEILLSNLKDLITVNLMFIRQPASFFPDSYTVAQISTRTS